MTAAVTAYYLGQLLVSLLLVVVLIYAVHYALRRWGTAGLALRQSGPATVVQSVPLSGGHLMHVVQVGGRTVLVGTGPGGVRTLAQWADDQPVEQEPDEEGGSASSPL